MSATIDEQFIEYIVKSLVGKPDEVKLVRSVDEKGVLLELTVDPEDLGRVIGKRGATAQSLRTLLRALGTKNDARYNLKIVDNGAPKPEREQREQREPRRDERSEETSAAAPATEGAWGSEEANEPAPIAQKQDDDEFDDEDEHNSVLSKTRKELDDLDDLDI